MRAVRLAKWLPGPLAALAAPAIPAAATGTLYCTADDRNLRFELLGNTSIDDGTMVAVHHASLKLKPGPDLQAAAEFAVGKDDIFQEWDFANDLRFAIRLDDARNNRKIVLAVMTVRDDKREKYVGR